MKKLLSIICIMLVAFTGVHADTKIEALKETMQEKPLLNAEEQESSLREEIFKKLATQNVFSDSSKTVEFSILLSKWKNASEELAKKEAENEIGMQRYFVSFSKAEWQQMNEGLKTVIDIYKNDDGKKRFLGYLKEALSITMFLDENQIDGEEISMDAGFPMINIDEDNNVIFISSDNDYGYDSEDDY